MKRLLSLLLILNSLFSYAQTADTTGKTVARYFNEAEQAAKSTRLWKVNIYGPTLFVDPQTRVAWANKPDSAGVLKLQNGIYKGTLPKNVMIANTAITWQGVKWSVIMWPLPKDHDDRLNLILHESFHRVQNQLGFPPNSPTADHLSTMKGRIYFLLELQALKAALEKPVTQRREDIQNALLFRNERSILFPKTFANERLLEMNEGLAEYTGVMLGRKQDSIRAHLFHIINTAEKESSLIRSATYITGPVYGYLLYENDREWTVKIDSSADLPALLAKYNRVVPQVPKSEADLTVLARKYNGNRIIKSETEKEEQHQKQITYYTNLFTQKPVLNISLVKMNINFNPNNLFDLGDAGTVYPTAEIKDVWGSLKVDSGGMLLKNWQVASVPAAVGVLNGPNIKGDGWELTLNPNWKVQKKDELHYEVVKKD